MTYKKGTWNYICPVCGFKYHADQVLRRWDGLYVCKKDFEFRHEQDFLRTQPESDNVTYIFKEPDVTITITTAVTSVTVTVLDEFGDPCVGKTIVPASSNTNIATVGNVSGVTDSNGQATFDITPVAIGTTTIVCTVDGVSSNTFLFTVEGT